MQLGYETRTHTDSRNFREISSYRTIYTDSKFKASIHGDIKAIEHTRKRIMP